MVAQWHWGISKELCWVKVVGPKVCAQCASIYWLLEKANSVVLESTSVVPWGKVFVAKGRGRDCRRPQTALECACPLSWLWRWFRGCVHMIKHFSVYTAHVHFIICQLHLKADWLTDFLQERKGDPFSEQDNVQSLSYFQSQCPVFSEKLKTGSKTRAKTDEN